MKGFRSFHVFNIKSVGQRAAKLLAVKVGGLKKSLLLGLSRISRVLPGLDSNWVQIILKF